MTSEPRPWALARKLQAIAQTGLEFNTNEYDRERYELIGKIAAELMAAHCDTPIETFQKIFDAQDGYATPKVDVRAAVFRDGKILLVREAADGLWTLPGGWADVNDAPHEAVEREVREESGFYAKATKLAAVYDRAKHPHEPPLPFHVYKMCFVCEIISGEATPSRETPEVAFFAPDALPPLSISRILEFQIRRLWEHAKNPALPTDFD
ncbi:MAG TPA: NUDIX hydrolase [Verrucomicrobiae bacterium]|jgi:ADP-ribose pyrophosphatase YjhB (NUDIX family)|nr:NUDIX hydrolase [Verrucomicrobiae bacterium]